ncbi:hypothetical protein FOE78_11175 [Microlunatus elymi]|uniref:WD40-like Beta Propeller Repeat n=1 Tax=Microlunatus elymi TaxID=2596828 RepID=A0A516PYZ6_9ACTN|nr:hypothetical protein [Microlunatus elymi]QDP96388.1 hypothetical protein FOE78_11175 [Microlunatus elymi]
MSDEPPPSPEDVDVLDSGQGGPRRPSLVGAIVAACCLIVVAVAVVRAYGDRDPASAPPNSPSPSAPSEPAVPRPTVVPSFEDVLTRTVELSWLGAGTDYSVFVRTGAALSDGDSGVYQLDPRHDRVVSHRVPALASTGPLSFVPVSGGVLVRPIDQVPGYFVPDDAPVMGTGNVGGIVLPGPDDRHVWIPTANGSHLDLVGAVDHHSTGTTITVPSGMYPMQLTPDGHGYLLGPRDDGLYDLRPQGAVRVADGALIAVGPTRVLAANCSDQEDCAPVLLNSNFTPVAPQPPLRSQGSVSSNGVISPDGKVAALLGAQGGPIVLVDLATGGLRYLKVQVAGYMSAQVAFSPDSKWLFVVGADHRAYAAEVATRQVRPLLPGVRGVAQLTVRPAA